MALCYYTVNNTFGKELAKKLYTWIMQKKQLTHILYSIELPVRRLDVSPCRPVIITRLQKKGSAQNTRKGRKIIEHGK